MGWFSPVKGSYPSLSQVDKTLPVKGELSIQRGTIVALAAGSNDKDEAEGVWELPSASSKSFYVALQDYNDPTAGYAGKVFDPGKEPGTPRITALDLNQDAEYETSVYDVSAAYTIGAELHVKADGTLTTGTGVTDDVVGYVTGIPTERWVNNAVALGGPDPRLAVRTGANVFVLRFKTK